jgi:hypothetical protein
VGRISLSYAPLETNQAPWRVKRLVTLVHEPAIPVVKGQKIGTFKMGSSVVVLSEGRRFEAIHLPLLRPVQCGESLVTG